MAGSAAEAVTGKSRLHRRLGGSCPNADSGAGVFRRASLLDRMRFLIVFFPELTVVDFCIQPPFLLIKLTLFVKLR